MLSDPREEPAARAWQPQFRLRTLFVAMVACSMLFAAMSLVGAIGASFLVLMFALVVLHVAGNFVGTRLRDTAPRRDSIAGRREIGLSNIGDDRSSLLVTGQAGAQRLCERRPLGSSLAVVSGAGAVAGGLVGRVALAYGQWSPLAPGDCVVGITSCAVLGGLAGFLLVGFVQVAVWPAIHFFFDRGGRTMCNDTTACDAQVADDAETRRAVPVR